MHYKHDIDETNNTSQTKSKSTINVTEEKNPTKPPGGSNFKIILFWNDVSITTVKKNRTVDVNSIMFEEFKIKRCSVFWFSRLPLWNRTNTVLEVWVSRDVMHYCDVTREPLPYDRSGRGRVPWEVPCAEYTE